MVNRQRLGEVGDERTQGSVHCVLGHDWGHPVRPNILSRSGACNGDVVFVEANHIVSSDKALVVPPVPRPMSDRDVALPSQYR